MRFADVKKTMLGRARFAQGMLKLPVVGFSGYLSKLNCETKM